MGARSKIEWTDSTFQPVGGLHEGRSCKGCALGMRLLLRGEMGKAEWSGRVGQPSPPPHYRSVLAQSLGLEQPGTVVPDRARTTSARVLRVAVRRVRQSGGPLLARGFVQPHSCMRSIGLAALDQATAKHSQDAAGRLGRRISERLARHDNGRRTRLQAASLAPSQSARSNSLRELRTGYWPARAVRH